jgi:hypothetical protein
MQAIPQLPKNRSQLVPQGPSMQVRIASRRFTSDRKPSFVVCHTKGSTAELKPLSHCRAKDGISFGPWAILECQVPAVGSRPTTVKGRCFWENFKLGNVGIVWVNHWFLTGLSQPIFVKTECLDAAAWQMLFPPEIFFETHHPTLHWANHCYLDAPSPLTGRKLFQAILRR